MIDSHLKVLISGASRLPILALAAGASASHSNTGGVVGPASAAVTFSRRCGSTAPRHEAFEFFESSSHTRPLFLEEELAKYVCEPLHEHVTVSASEHVPMIVHARIVSAMLIPRAHTC